MVRADPSCQTLLIGSIEATLSFHVAESARLWSVSLGDAGADRSLPAPGPEAFLQVSCLHANSGACIYRRQRSPALLLVRARRPLGRTLPPRPELRVFTFWGQNGLPAKPPSFPQENASSLARPPLVGRILSTQTIRACQMGLSGQMICQMFLLIRLMTNDRHLLRRRRHASGGHARPTAVPGDVPLRILGAAAVVMIPILAGGRATTMKKFRIVVDRLEVQNGV